ncbi:dTDP-glucose 4,6-dehydratase [Bdellovibrionota bacterium FG-1]
MSSQKTLIVTGACGFIGSNFVRQAVRNGQRIIVLDALTYAGHRENIKGIQGAGSVELAEGDICDPLLIQSLFEKNTVHALVNFAAESHVDRSISGPQAFIQTNIFGTFNLLSAALKYWKGLPAGAQKDQFRYLQVSTDEVYGSLGATGKFHEKLPYEPNSPYSASKAGADHLVRAWHHTYGLPTLTTNCSNNYGPYQFPEKLIPHMINCAMTDQPLPVYGDGGNIRDWIHVEDHCSGIKLALEKGTPGETYCFGGNSERNNLDVVKNICKELDTLCPRKDGKRYETRIQFVTDRMGHDRRYAIDDSKAQKELGFTRKYRDFEEGLRSTIQWYLDHQPWCKAVLKERTPS